MKPEASERVPICQPDPLRTLFSEAGLQDIDVRTIDVPTHFQDFEDYWSPLLGGQFPSPDYAMSLSENDCAASGERIRDTLPVSEDGTIRLVARAWAIRGQKSKV